MRGVPSAWLSRRRLREASQRCRAGGDAAEHVVAGEQHERAAVGAAGVVLDRFDARLFVVAALGAGRIGHVAQRDQLGLLAVVERAADLNRVALRQADARLEEVERRPSASGGAMRRRRASRWS